MLLSILKMFGLVVLQNASFTLVSRARNSKSIWYHTVASVLSNGIWLLVIRQVVLNLDNWVLMVTYLVGAVIGSISMHYIAMKWFEKPKKVNSSEMPHNHIIDKIKKGHKYPSLVGLHFTEDEAKLLKTAVIEANRDALTVASSKALDDYLYSIDSRIDRQVALCNPGLKRDWRAYVKNDAI